MTSDVRTCRPDTNLAEAVGDMWEGDCGALPVVNDEGRVTGALGTVKAHRVRRLPVIDAEGHVRGILSLNDVVTHSGSASPTEVVSTLAGICEHRRPITMSAAVQRPRRHRVSTSQAVLREPPTLVQRRSRYVTCPMESIS
jgi:CBS-domain-containing membrane protein